MWYKYYAKEKSDIFFKKNLHIPKKSSNFAPDFAQ